MRAIERYQYQLHAQLPAFLRKVDWTKHILQDALQKKDVQWMCAFSGGIDSTVMLDLLFEQQAIPVYWGDDGIDYPESLAFLTETEQRYGFHLQRIRCLAPWNDWCLEMARPDLVAPPITPEIEEAWLNPHEWTDTWSSLKDARSHGYGGVFLGLLASESRTRRWITQNGRRALYQVKSEDRMWHCCPLAHWSKQEVWAYAVSRNLPYNPVYDLLAEQEVPLLRRRVAPLTCFRVMQYGSHAILKAGWPSLYNHLCTIFPKVREY